MTSKKEGTLHTTWRGETADGHEAIIEPMPHGEYAIWQRRGIYQTLDDAMRVFRPSRLERRQRRLQRRGETREPGDGDEPEYEDEPEEFDQSELESGAVISDSRSGYSVSFDGSYLDSFKDFDDALLAVYKHAEKVNYYPNFYYVNERGNVDLLRIKPVKRRGKVVKVTSEIVQSWV